ncbi:MAG: hypothetical protein ACTH8J_06045 [Specibacter sp.]
MAAWQGVYEKVRAELCPGSADAWHNGGTINSWEGTIMKFVLEVDLDAVKEEPGPELARILRYWAGNLNHYALEPGVAETVMDSAYSPVGAWRIEADNA